MKKDDVAIGRTYLAKVSDKVVPVRIDLEHPRQGWFGTNQVTNKRIHIKSAQRLRCEAKRVSEAMAKAEAVKDEPTTAPDEADAEAQAQADAEWLGEALFEVEQTAAAIAETAPPAEPSPNQDRQQATPTPEPTRKTPSYEERLMFAGATDPAAAREALANTTLSGTENDMSGKTTKKGSKKTEAKATTKAPGAAKPKREPKEKKLSALDAAAKVLRESKEPMTTGEMIEAMAKKGYWSSPNGQTPSATLYSALLREINTKAKDSRFTRTARGKFAIKA